VKENKTYQVGDDVEVKNFDGLWVPAVILQIFKTGGYRSAKVFIKKEYLERWQDEEQQVGFYNIR